MKIVDLVIIAIIAAAVVLAVRNMIKRKKNGSGCCGNCSSCAQNCKK